MRCDGAPIDPQLPVDGDVGQREGARSTAALRLRSQTRANTTIASSLVGLAGALQIPILIQLCQLTQTLLQFLPSGYSFPRSFLRPFRNVVAGRLVLLPTVADIQVRAMLGSALLAMTARPSAGAVGF